MYLVTTWRVRVKGVGMVTGSPNVTQNPCTFRQSDFTQCDAKSMYISAVGFYTDFTREQQPALYPYIKLFWGIYTYFRDT